MHNGNKRRSPAWWLFYSTWIKEREGGRYEREGEEVRGGRKSRVKEVQDIDMCGRKEWGGLVQNRRGVVGEREREVGIVEVRWCRVR